LVNRSLYLKQGDIGIVAIIGDHNDLGVIIQNNKEFIDREGHNLGIEGYEGGWFIPKNYVKPCKKQESVDTITLEETISVLMQTIEILQKDKKDLQIKLDKARGCSSCYTCTNSDCMNNI
jgi:hypothetical protein